VIARQFASRLSSKNGIACGPSLREAPAGRRLNQILTVALFTKDDVPMHEMMRGWVRCRCFGMCFSESRS
jgi:hypothetical protein